MTPTKESLAKAREILEHLEAFPDGSVVLVAAEPVAGYQLDKSTIKELCESVIAKDPGLLVEALELISIMDSPMGFAGCPAVARNALAKWKGE